MTKEASKKRRKEKNNCKHNPKTMNKMATVYI